jgi:hypothetical protein
MLKLVTFGRFSVFFVCVRVAGLEEADGSVGNHGIVWTATYGSIGWW